MVTSALVCQRVWANEAGTLISVGMKGITETT